MDDDAQLGQVERVQLRNLMEVIGMYNGDDPLLPWIRCLKCLKTSRPADGFSSVYCRLLDQCIKAFANTIQYHSDTRYVQIWIQFADCCHAEAESVFKRMEALHIGQDSALYYGAYAIYLEAQDNIAKAYNVYQTGLSRRAKPTGMLEAAYKGFLKRVAKHHKSSLMKEANSLASSNTPISREDSSAMQNSQPVDYSSLQSTKMAQTLLPLQDVTNVCYNVYQSSLAASMKSNEKNESLPTSRGCREVKASSVNNFTASTASLVDPWENDIVNKLLNSLNPPLVQYKGFYSYNQKHQGASLMSLKSAPHNKVLKLGAKRYHLKGCTGQGAFAQVFKACEEQDKENIVVLKIQKPPCPWEFYIYSQLNKRIPKTERASFGRAWKMHVYEDCSIMVCAYGERGTLQDVINSYIATGQKMDELLCMYYTVEMLRLLEVLHSSGILHGDLKPDNLLIRNEGEILEDWAPDRPGCWIDQGLCLIDWGRSIDLNLLPPGTMLDGDCKTSGFQCIEMQQHKPWTFQVDTYGLCCIVHIMLHGSYMEIDAETTADTTQIFRPKIPLKRYHQRELWGELFSRLLNVKSCQENPSLSELRGLFQSYLTNNTQFPKKIKELMVRQSKIMWSRN